MKITLDAGFKSQATNLCDPTRFPEGVQFKFYRWMLFKQSKSVKCIGRRENRRIWIANT